MGLEATFHVQRLGIATFKQATLWCVQRISYRVASLSLLLLLISKPVESLGPPKERSVLLYRHDKVN